MISKIKSASHTRLYDQESASSLIPLKFISLINSDNIEKYRSGNNISSREKFHNYSCQTSIKSLNDTYRKISNNTHFPIVNIQQDTPTVPKKADTFIHRLVNKFFSITNTNENHQDSSRIKRKRRRRCLKSIKTNNNNNSTKHCNVCRKHRNCFSTIPSDSLEYPSQSSKIFNTNAVTTQKSLPKIQLKKFRTLNNSQYQTILSAIELIFDTLISNYQ